MLHALLGLLVGPSPATAPAATESARTVTLVNYALVGLPADSGSSTTRDEQWTVRNAGPALHQLLVLRLRDSTDLPEVAAWIARGASVLLPPAPIVLNTDALLRNESFTQRVRLTPGLYLALCFVPQGRDAAGEIVDHSHLGMRYTFVVRP
ncbi:MAG: hypothetical protein MUF00_00075 [Gemmatimonadaceae bacterium]|jgi:hypothetical protein|nr:hypothetical protein [Gemmatimonadaceae bacterium]